MRDQNDTKTREFPTLPPFLPKTTIAQRIELRGYAGPGERKRCGNCLHCAQHFNNPDTTYKTEVLHCRAGDFNVQKGGICPQWEPA